MATVEQPVPGLTLLQVRVRFARALSMLYFVRTGVSLTWVITVSALSSSLGQATAPNALIESFLILYPLADAAATLIDIRTTPPQSQTRFQRVNLVTSLITAVALLGVAQRGFGAILDVFGLWAIVSGVIQLVVAVRRHTLISAQWFMVISGAGSIFAGTTFLSWSGSAHDGLAVLVQYSTGGAIWYVIAALWLLVTAFRASATT
jgi:hypothetical protein